MILGWVAPASSTTCRNSSRGSRYRSGMEPDAMTDLGRPLDEWEQHALDSITEFGEALGTAYERVWDAPETMVAVVNSAAGAEVDSVLKSRPGVEHAVGGRILRWSLFLIGFTVFIVMMVANGNAETDSDSGGVYALMILWLLISVGWFYSLQALDKSNKHHAAEGVTLRALLLDAAVGRAIEVVVHRRVDAQNHTPSDDPTLPFEPKGPIPPPQQYGVSHEGAERLVEGWMRYFCRASDLVAGVVSC